MSFMIEELDSNMSDVDKVGRGITHQSTLLPDPA
jgi:hypothetical protein